MTTLGRQRRFDLKYNFEVSIAGVTEMGFATCSEPSVATGEALLWQGGSLIPIKEPTRLTFNDITLERGMSRDMDIWNWYKQTSDAASSGNGTANTGASHVISPLFKRHIAILQKDRMGSWVERIELFNAYPKEVSLGDFSNDADEFRIERLVFSYDYFDRIPLTAF